MHETGPPLPSGLGDRMANPWARDRATHFYLGYAFFGLVVIGFGFGITYVAPMIRRSFSAPWFVHLHGAFALGWVLLLIAQAQLVRGRRTPLHRRLGVVAIPLAVLIWLSGVATAVWAAERDFSPQGSAATSSLAGTFSGLMVYLLLVMAAVALRRRPDWHKRLIVLATIQLLWPAFFRLRHWMPSIPNPDVWFAFVMAYSPIVIAAVRDRVRWGRIHPVWLFWGPAVVLEQSIEFMLFDRGPMRALGAWLYQALS